AINRLCVSKIPAAGIANGFAGDSAAVGAADAAAASAELSAREIFLGGDVRGEGNGERNIWRPGRRRQVRRVELAVHLVGLNTKVAEEGGGPFGELAILLFFKAQQLREIRQRVCRGDVDLRK